MNWNKVAFGTTLAAAVMILVTFAPESALAPLKSFMYQLRQNNVSAVQAEDAASGVSISGVAKSVRKALQ